MTRGRKRKERARKPTAGRKALPFPSAEEMKDNARRSKRKSLYREKGGKKDQGGFSGNPFGEQKIRGKTLCEPRSERAMRGVEGKRHGAGGG